MEEQNICMYINEKNTFIKYNPRFRINRGTLVQLFYHINTMQNLEIKENNKFHKIMFPKIIDICNNLVQHYNLMLNKYLSNNTKYTKYTDIFAYFICGPHKDGIMYKPTTNKNEMKTYDYCELGFTIRTIKDRLYHIERVANNRINIIKYNDDIEIYKSLIKFSIELKSTIEKYGILWKNEINTFNTFNTIQDSLIITNLLFFTTLL